ncbi:MAG: phosphonate metabolism protein/1,5-bisphosphokinase (PRPP-forming) PhnN [Rhodospirillales bacterium]
MRAGQGRLFLVVGPSGAGKDSLIAAAHARLRDDPAFVFPRRLITRPASAGGEPHIAIDMNEFDRMTADGRFALCWRAHGLGYGVPAEIAADLAAGRRVIVNASRTVLDAARKTFPGLCILSIQAAPEVLAARLAARGRATDGDLAARLARASLSRPEGADVIEIDNSGEMAAAAEAFLAAVRV